MPEPLISDVSDTASWVAHYRAVENERPDALFRDPFAAKLAGDKGRGIATTIKGSRWTEWTVVIRTCLIDDFIRDLIKGGADMVVNLGAGLDSRPYRLDLPRGFKWIEVDYPHMIEYKEEKLKGDVPRCDLKRFKLDLSDRPARQKLFGEISKEGQNIIVLTEGVIPYLTVDQVGTLADDLRARSNFKNWISDYLSSDVIRYIQKLRNTDMKNAPFQFDPGDWFGFFAKHGWSQKTIRYYPGESVRRGRAIPMPLWAKVLGIFAGQKRREGFKTSAGYTILQPADAK